MPQTIDAKGQWMQRVLAAYTLTGDKVVNRQKEDLGTIEHLMIDVEQGRIAYAVLSFGGLSLIHILFVAWYILLSHLEIGRTERSFILRTRRAFCEQIGVQSRMPVTPS